MTIQTADSIGEGLEWWLGRVEGNRHESLLQRKWWVLPSAARPRVLVPTDPCAWPAALELIHSAASRMAVRLLIRGMRAARVSAGVSASVPCPLDEWLGEIFPNAGRLRYAVYVGSPSCFRKDTVQCISEAGRVLGFIKIPAVSGAVDVVKHEREVLEELARRFPCGNFFPKVIGSRGGLWIQSPPYPQKEGMHGALNPAELLESLRLGWCVRYKWEESPVRATILEGINAIRESGEMEWSDTLESALAKLAICYGENTISHPLSHGDFIPWNIRPGPFAFDWEWADARTPWYDAFHFLWMPHIRRKRGKSDVTYLWNLWTGPPGEAIRFGRVHGEEDWAHACSYLGGQFAFYASSFVRDGYRLRQSALLCRLHRTLSGFLNALDLRSGNR